MAAYGRGQMLGTGIDPRLMTMDYSPFVDVAATQAKGIATLGANIGGVIAKVGDYKKQQAEDERLVQKSKSVAKAIGDLIPDLQPTIQESMMILDDKEIPLSRRKAEAEAISDILNLGINEVRNRQEIGIKQRELGVREAANIAEMTQLDRDYQNKANQRQAKVVKVGEFDVAVVEDGFGNIYDPVTDRPITNLAAFALNRDDFGPADLPQDGMVLPPREFPDGVPTDGVPIPPADFDYNQMPMLPEDRLVAPETVQAIEAAAAPRAIPRTSAQASTQTYTIDELKELKDQGVKFNAQPAKEEGKFTLTSISPATPGVQINMGDKRADKMDEQLFKQKEELAQAAAGKDNIIGMINLLNEGVKTGFGQDVLTKGKRVLGMDVSNAETFKARAGAAAMNFINLTKGAISDREMTYFTTVLAPNIGNSVEGNKKIADFMLAAIEKANKIEKTIADGLRNNENAFDIDRKVMEIRNSNEIIGGNTEQNSTTSREKTAAEKLREKIKQ